MIVSYYFNYTHKPKPVLVKNYIVPMSFEIADSPVAK